MQLSGIRQKVFLDRYSRKDKTGKAMEKSPQEMWKRVAKGVASFESDPKQVKLWEKKFFSAMEDFKYVPGGRILSGAGTGYKVTFYNCLPPNQEVLTTEGYRPIKDVKVGDLVITGKKRAREVKQVFVRKAAEPLYHIKVKKISFDEVSLTGEHPILTIKKEWVNSHRSRDGLKLINKPAYIVAKDIQKDDFVAVAWNAYERKTDTLELSDFLPNKFSTINGYIWKTQLKKKVKDEIKIDEDFMLLAGTWLGDGCITHRTGTDIPAGIQITFNSKEKKQADHIAAILQEKFQIIPTVREDRWGQKLIQVRVESLPVGLFFKNLFGYYSYGKRIPQILARQPLPLIYPLIKGLFLADGYLSKEVMGILLANKTLATQLHELLLRTGRFFTIFENTHRLAAHKSYRVQAGVSQANGLTEYVFNNKKKNLHHDQNYYIEYDGLYWVRVVSIKTSPYEGLVYDLEVEEDHSFVTAGVVVSNCYVLPSPNDSRDGILDNLKEMVEIMARGGGVGINLSSLRPRGARVRKVNGFSSGPMNWAELYSVATKDIIQQGGCFSPDTKIMTHRGLISIEEIMQSRNNYYAATHQGYKKITAKFDNGVKKLYEVETKAGFKVKTTREHKFLTFDTEGRFYLKMLSDFKVGEQLVYLLGDWSDELPYAILNTNLPTPSKYSYGLKKVLLPKELTENLAFVLGAYDADGSRIPDEYNSNGKGIRIAIAENKPFDLKRLTASVKRCFGEEPKIRKGDGAVKIIQIFSRQLNEFLKLNKLLKKSSVEVRVPAQIFTSPKRVVEAYIAGVFLGDGTNQGGKGGLRICTVSESFACDLQLLLLNLGIAAKIKKQIRKENNWRTLYTVTVNGATYMKRFVNFLLPYTEKALDKKISIRDGFFSWPFNMVERFIYVPKYQRTQARTNPTTSQKSVLFLQQMAPALQERDRTDVEFLGNCIPDKISSISYVGEEKVYDLEVEDAHLLSGNGFYTSNSRRGALMLMLWDWHPDIEEFITVKQDLSRINGANLSVCVSDKFMDAVKKDKDWELVFPDFTDSQYDEKWDGYMPDWLAKGKKVKVYKKIKARKLWDLICQAAWRSAEPGVVFMERYNKWHSNYYFNRINCVNPCVTGDTLVATEFGWLPAGSLKPGIKIATPYGLRPIKKVYNNGKKRIYKITFSDGGDLKATSDHKLKVVRGKKYQWVKTVDLKKGDKVVVVDKTYFGVEELKINQEVSEYATNNKITLNKGNDRSLGFIIGTTIGDGYFGQIGKKLGYRMKLSVGREESEWRKILEHKLQQFGVVPKFQRFEKLVLHADGTSAVHGADQLMLYKFANVLGLLGLETRTGSNKRIPLDFFNLNSEFQKGVLDGLFSTDGSVSMKSYDPILRLSSSSRTLLEQVRLILLNFGIHARIYKLKRKKTMYDDRELTSTGVKYDLYIMNEGISKFWREIGLTHPDKKKKLKNIADNYYFMGGTNLAKVINVVDTKTEEEVFDVYEPDTLTWITNGYVSLDCGEEGLPSYGVCNLGSLNLAAFVNNKGKLDFDSLYKHAKIATRFQDDVIDGDVYIFDNIRKTQLEGERRIGLGTMGLGDALIKMKIRYGSKESLKIIDKIYKLIRDGVFEASIDIAAEKGAFPKFDKAKYLKGYFIKQLPSNLRQKIAKTGIRNSVLLMQAPTGSTSLMVGVSSGIEPVYEFSFTRRDRLGEHKLYHPLYDEFVKNNPNAQKPDYFVSSSDLTPEDHVKVQAVIQKYVDASISKTVNAPAGFTVEDVKKLYTLAYELGCKGITFMRDGSRPGVLEKTIVKSDKPFVNGEVKIDGVQIPVKRPRPMVVHGSTYQVETPVGITYVTINVDDNKEPFEVFVTVGKAGSDLQAMADALGRLISLNLRIVSPLRPTDRMKKVSDQLIGIGGARSIGFGDKKVRSLPDALAKVLATHFGFQYNNGHNADKVEKLSGNGEILSTTTQSPLPYEARDIDICPECGLASLAFEEGCKKCYSCGYSEC